MARGKNGLTNPVSDPEWYKGAIVYETHVRAFADSSGDGMGDFKGLTGKLDYLQDLGVTAIWLLPFFPSPWKDDGYDISSYTEVHPAYGTLRDFEAFLRQAHARGMRVITEMVMNHTSDRHEWFQKSRRAAPGSRWRNYYVWSDTAERYEDARIIFKDAETSNWAWDPVAKAYYWHRFYSHQPDLNFDNPEVRSAIGEAVEFWLDLGVDGLRLDAVPYLYEREGTNCENLPETHAYLRALRAHIDSKYKDRLLLAEANQWPEDAIAYFGAGDECQMAFHFPLMPRMFMAMRMEDRYPITEILRVTPAIPESCQWALFLRNHDELTLEMVSDEERDYMYRVYATDRAARINLGIRRRLAPLLENDRRRIELMYALLFSLPGTPVIYYGDEIGMGDNFYLGDRNGVRTPMQWSDGRNAGFSTANPQRLYLPVVIDPEYHYEAVNVENQCNNSHSLLWWVKRLIALRKQSDAFGRGSLVFLNPSNRRILAFIRSYGAEKILIVANLSRFVQFAALSLEEFQGLAPVEMFGESEFPPISSGPYPLSLGPHAFYWFALREKPAASEDLQGTDGLKPLAMRASNWAEALAPAMRGSIEQYLPGFLRARRWFLGRPRTITRARIADVIPFPNSGARLLIVRAEYGEGDPDLYLLPLSLVLDGAEEIARDIPEAVFARLEGDTPGAIYSAVRNAEFSNELMGLMIRRKRLAGERGELAGVHTRALRKIWGAAREATVPTLAKGEQRNTSIVFGSKFVLKLIRKIDPGPHPEVEMGEALAGLREPPRVPPLAGWLEYRTASGEAMTAAVLHAYERNETGGWRFTLENLSLYFDHALALPPEDSAKIDLRRSSLEALLKENTPDLARTLIGSYLDMIDLLGRRTAEFHLAAARVTGPAFEPEPFTDHYRLNLYHGLTAHCGRVFDELGIQLARLPEDSRADCEELLGMQSLVQSKFQYLRDRRLHSFRIRIHGNYDLPQVLYTGKDFVIIDLEGEPDRPLSERRIKRSPLRDVAGMLQSFYYASHGALYGQVPGVITREASLPALERWAGLWRRWVSVSFLRGYLNVPGIGALLPRDVEETASLLEVFIIEKALQETAHELINRPDWVRIPVRAILGFLRANR